MTATLDRSEWLTERRFGIGSSDAAGVLGVQPTGWPGERPIYEEKVGNVEADDLAGNEAVYWGTVLEAPVRDTVERRLACAVDYEGPYSIRHCESWPFAHATLDGYFKVCIGTAFVDLFIEANANEVLPHGPGVLEIKTTGDYAAKHWDHETWPLHYQVQTQHQLAVTGWEWGVLAVLVGGQTLKLIPFRRHEKFIAGMMEAETEFWRRVQDRDPPEPDGSIATAQVLAKLYRSDEGGEVALPDEALVWDAALVEAKADRAAAERSIVLNENRIKDAIGEHSAGVLPDGARYTWRSQTRKAFEVEKSTFRVLRRKD